jgi:S1-C subfamily serine protease
VRVPAVVCVAALSTLIGCDQAGTESVPTIQVTRVEATGCDRPQPRLGVGAVVADGVVLTAAHVVEGDLRELRVDDEQASVVGLDVESDLALLALEGAHDAEPSWNVAPASAGVPGPVDILTPDGAIRTELARTLTLRVEDISAGGTTERAALELATVVEEGDSGSPVVDAGGRLLGVFVLRRPSTGVSYASRIPAFTDLLDTTLYQEVLSASAPNADGGSFARESPCT